MITQFELFQILAYSPYTGLFTWLVRKANRIQIGDKAGRLINGYIQIKIDDKLYYAHRLAILYMTGLFPENDVDHKDLNRSNNKWNNLREATRSQNNWNTGLSSNNISGHKGVSWNSKSKKWYVRIMIKKENIYLGVFDDKNQAIEVYKNAAIKYRGEFART